MQMNHGALRPTETAIIIQASIMELNRQQVLLRDVLVKAAGSQVSLAEIDDYVRRLGPQTAADWMEVLRLAEDKDDALAQLSEGQMAVSFLSFAEFLPHQ